MPSHNCIIIFNVQFSRYKSESLQETQWSFNFRCNFSQFLKKWWRLAGSNRWPPACKAGALPAELNPQIFFEVVGQGLTCPGLNFYFALFLKWWAKMDSNHRPHDYQSCALASWAIGPYQLHFFFRYIFTVPSKLNNAEFHKHLSDLRTLLIDALLYQKSP